MKTNILCSDCTINCFIRQYCVPAQIGLVETEKNTTGYKKDEYIFREGDTVFGIYFIQHGGVKVISDNLNGRQQIVRLSKPGNILGYRALGKSRYYFNAVALNDTTVCFIENGLYHNLCRSNNDLAYNLMLHYAHELGRTGLRMKFQSQMNVREKVAEAFVYFNEVFGLNPATKTLNIPLSRQDIADLAGTTSEQVSRQLTEFEEEKLIIKNKRDIQIPDIRALEEIVKRYKIS